MLHGMNRAERGQQTCGREVFVNYSETLHYLNFEGASGDMHLPPPPPISLSLLHIVNHQRKTIGPSSPNVDSSCSDERDLT